MSLNKRLINTGVAGGVTTPYAYAYIQDDATSTSYFGYYDLSDHSNVTVQNALTSNYAVPQTALAVDSTNQKIYAGSTTALTSYDSVNPLSITNLDSYAANNIKHIEVTSPAKVYFSRFTSTGDNAIEYIIATDPSNLVQVAQATSGNGTYNTFPTALHSPSSKYCGYIQMGSSTFMGVNLTSTVGFTAARIQGASNITALGNFHDIDTAYTSASFGGGGLFLVARQGKVLGMFFFLFGSGYPAESSFQFEYNLPVSTVTVTSVVADSTNKIAYAVCDDNKLLALDYSDGSTLTLSNQITLTNSVGARRIFPDYANNTLYIFSNSTFISTTGNYLNIVDITNRTSPVQTHSYNFGNQKVMSVDVGLPPIV